MHKSSLSVAPINVEHWGE